MAATSTRNLQEGDDPDRGLRLFWCVVITLIPLSILFTGASLETMKTTVVLTALPFLVILLVKVGGFIRWLKQDYADKMCIRDRSYSALSWAGGNVTSKK